MKLTLTNIVILSFFTVPVFSELISETDNQLISASGMWKQHTDPLFVLGMGLLVVITILYIATQIVDEMNRRKFEAQNQKIQSLHKQIEHIQQAIQTLKQERILNPQLNSYENR